MARHPRKKQKIAESAPEPLGSHPLAHDDADKDDEERRLESILFGKSFKPSESLLADHHITLSEDDVGHDGAFDGLNDIGQLGDADLFFMDDALPEQAREDEVDDVAYLIESSQEDDGDRGDGGDDVDHPDQIDETVSSSKPELLSIKLTRSKPSAWVDSDDATLTVSLAGNTRLRKLRDAPEDDLVGGAQYEAKLRREYERIHPAPAWAMKQRKRSLPGDADAAEDNDLSNLLSETNGLLRDGKAETLPKGLLAVERLRDANQSAKAEGQIKALQFHPSPQVSLLMTASSDRRLRLFNVDGHSNPHIQTIHLPALPLTSACFHPSGSSILLTGPRPFYYVFDLQSGLTSRSPRGLWGTFSQATQAAGMGMEISAFDPSGAVLAVAGRGGQVHLVDWTSGAAQVVGSVKMNAPVKALWWSRRRGEETPQLLTLAQDAQVYIWDVGERKCLRRWKDDGGYGSICMAGDSLGKYLAIGSKSGIVNMYGEDSLLTSSSSRPRLLKDLGNLTTSISSLRFNHDSQVLAVASADKKDQLRLVHLPSLTAFSNWPTSSTPLGHVTAVDFSARSEYVAVGNNRGRVLLYHLPHFTSSR